jgi:hypothetical protein
VARQSRFTDTGKTSVPALIAMKQLANRPRDLDDIEHLRWILEEKPQ